MKGIYKTKRGTWQVYIGHHKFKYFKTKKEAIEMRKSVVFRPPRDSLKKGDIINGRFEVVADTGLRKHGNIEWLVWDTKEEKYLVNIKPNLMVKNYGVGKGTVAKSMYPNISLVEPNGNCQPYYVFYKTVSGIRYSKTFKSLNDAITYRDNFSTNSKP